MSIVIEDIYELKISLTNRNKITNLPYIEGYSFDTVQNHSYIYVDNDSILDKFKNQAGQINFNTEFGFLINQIAQTEPNLTNWLEIGTWNGLGTTQCILEGFLESSNKQNMKLISIEADPVMFGVAQINLANHPAISCVEFINNTLYNSQTQVSFPTPHELKDEDKGPHFFIHYEREKTLWEKSSGFQIPFSPHVVVLDGGEYTGYIDWLNIDKTQLQYVILDDVNIYKNNRVLLELLNDSTWKCVNTNKDRNGWAIFNKIK